MKNRRTRLREDQWRAMEMISNHDLLEENYWHDGCGARWVIGKLGTFVSRLEVFAGIGGSLIVHGDFDVVRFAHYSDHYDAFSRLCWMGLCQDVDYYVLQKASIGMGRRGGVEAYDEDVARDYLEDVIRDAKESGRDPELIEVVQRAIDHHLEDERELRQYLGSAGWRWDLWELDPGKVVDSHVVVAHIALNKLCALLFERHGDEGPPQCRLQAARRVA